MRFFLAFAPFGFAMLASFVACVGDDAATSSSATDAGADSPASTQEAAVAGFDFSVAPTVVEITVGKSATATASTTATSHAKLPVTVQGLPTGVTMDAAAIDSSQSSVQLTFSAASDAVPTVADLTLTASDGVTQKTATLRLAVKAVPGTLDTTFGSGSGSVDVVGDGFPIALIVLPSGAIPVLVQDNGAAAGRILQRLSTGAPDTTFGTGGAAALPTMNVTSFARASDQSFFVFGGANVDGVPGGDICVQHVSGAGGRDTTFGASGIASIGVGNGSDAFGVRGLLRADGKPIVGAARDSLDLVYTRFTATGTNDLAPVFTSVATNPDFLAWFAIASDNADGMVLGGQLLSGGTPANSAGRVTKLTATGALDSSFGSGGSVAIDAGGVASVRALARQSDGKWIAAGAKGANAGATTRVRRLTTTGALDATFGNAGLVAPTFGTSPGDVAYGVAIDASGRIVVVGSAGFGPSAQAYVLRLRADGSPDTTFGQNGVALLPHPVSVDEAAAVAIAQDGKIVVAVKRTIGSTPATVLFRVNP